MYESAPILSTEVLLNLYKRLPLRDWSEPVDEKEPNDVDSSKYQEGTVYLQAVFHVQICLGGCKEENVAHGGGDAAGYTTCPGIQTCKLY